VDRRRWPGIRGLRPFDNAVVRGLRRATLLVPVGGPAPMVGARGDDDDVISNQ